MYGSVQVLGGRLAADFASRNHFDHFAHSCLDLPPTPNVAKSQLEQQSARSPQRHTIFFGCLNSFSMNNLDHIFRNEPTRFMADS